MRPAAVSGADDDVLLSLGHVAPATPLTAARAAALRQPDRALDILRRHRVVGLGSNRIAAGPGRGSVPEQIRAAADRRNRTRELLDDVRAKLAVAADGLGIPVAGVKGDAARVLYDRPEHRDVSDLDLMVADADDAWRLAGWLREQGHVWHPLELPWIKRDTATGRVYGQVPIGSIVDGLEVGIDIHFGGYSVRHCRLLPCPIPGPGLHRLDPARNLPLLLANAAGDFVIRQKDVDDVVLMVQAGPAIDWEPALAAIRELRLDRFWNALLRQTLRTSALTDRARARAAALTFSDVSAERVPFGAKAWRARCRATVMDSFRAGRERGGPVDGLKLAWSAYRYYRRPLRMDPGGGCRHGGRHAMLLRTMANDTCVRLIPAALVRVEDTDAGTVSGPARPIPGTAVLQEEILNGHCYVRAAGERFATTVFYDICDDQRNC